MFNRLKQAYMPKTTFPVRAIDKIKCSQCRRCFDTCPIAGYEWGEDNFPKPVGFGGLEQACMGCWSCVAVCPKDAINVDGCYSVHKGRYETQLENRMKYPEPLGTQEKKSYKDIKGELTEVERVIYERRSVRLFKDKPVPDEMIKRVLEAGRFAPSAGNGQPYKFIVIKDKKLIKELEHTSMYLLRFLKFLYLDKKGKRRLWKNLFMTIWSLMKINSADQRPMAAMKKAQDMNEAIYWNSPVVIIICKDIRGISNPDLDAGVCLQNMLLAAHSLKLGTCAIGLAMEPLNYPIVGRKIKNKLGIKHPFEAVTSISIGYPKGIIDGIVKRDSPIVEWF